MNLVIGDNSQLSKYFPDDYVRISSRNINSSTFSENYENAFITFAEQRTFNTNLTEVDFVNVNVEYTSKVIDFISKKSKKVVVFGTAELWNNCDGPIDINTPINYKYSPYIKSKEILWQEIKQRRLSGDWSNVFIIHPFNFNSIHRKEGFLFYKFFDSLINKTIHEVGNINIERDIIHPKYLVEKSITCDSDLVVGSGKTTNIKDFVKSLFDFYRLDIGDYIKEKDLESYHQGNRFWLDTSATYDGLLNDTISELNNIIKYEKY